MDTLSASERSERMALIRAKDTKVELAVRRLIHRMGFRYRLYDQHIPGKPDIVFKGRRKLIFVHGCFWHGHSGCKKARIPKSRRRYWTAKINGNKRRDAKILRKLKNLNWDVMIVWECELARRETLPARLKRFLEKPCLCKKTRFDAVSELGG